MDEIGKALLEVVLPSVGVVLTALASWAAKRLVAKLGVELSAREQEMLSQAARRAVGAASEWAAKRAEIQTDPVAGAERLGFAMKLLERQFPKLTPDDLDAAIHAEIAFMEGVGAQKPALGGGSGIVRLPPS